MVVVVVAMMVVVVAGVAEVVVAVVVEVAVMVMVVVVVMLVVVVVYPRTVPDSPLLALQRNAISVRALSASKCVHVHV